jgi:hypothetical protein
MLTIKMDAGKFVQQATGQYCLQVKWEFGASLEIERLELMNVHP